jgi:hypothetical protein
MKHCAQCETPLPEAARFCHHCGAPQFLALEAPPRPLLDWKAELPPQFMELFFQRLDRAIVEEQDPRRGETYHERLHARGFDEILRRRFVQLAGEIRRVNIGERAVVRGVERRVESALSELIDLFFIRHCADINANPLPEAILRYAQALPQEVDIGQMIHDFLDLEKERETEAIYLARDFIQLSPDELRAAGKYFLFPAPSERILLLVDQGLLGAFRQGVAFTERALYWKAHLEEARQAPYDSLNELKREKNWLLINGHYFHVNPAFDVKTLKLLRKLRGWRSA